LAIIFSLALFKELLVLLKPNGASLVILLAYTHRWHLPDEVVGCHYSKNDLVFEELFFGHLELDFFSDEVLRVVALPIGLLADGNHGFDIVDFSQILIFHHWGPQGCWPDVESRIVFADALFPGVLHSVVNTVGTTYLLDDSPSIFDVIFEVTWLKIENDWFLVEEIILIRRV
jgi:hypothetical protein